MIRSNRSRLLYGGSALLEDGTQEKVVKKKTAKLARFMDELHTYIVTNPQFRKKTGMKSEVQIQAELRPLVIRFLEKHFETEGYKDFVAKANQSFYWEGQEGKYGRGRTKTFGARNYPDFIITDPYLVAIEYKQSPNGSTVKQGVGQSILHALCGDFDFVYYLFHDESPDKRIERSTRNELEKSITACVWSNFNVMLRFV